MRRMPLLMLHWWVASDRANCNLSQVKQKPFTLAHGHKWECAVNYDLNIPLFGSCLTSGQFVKGTTEAKTTWPVLHATSLPQISVYRARTTGATNNNFIDLTLFSWNNDHGQLTCSSTILIPAHGPLQLEFIIRAPKLHLFNTWLTA